MAENTPDKPPTPAQPSEHPENTEQSAGTEEQKQRPAVLNPTSEEVEAVIQAATSQRSEPDGKIIPLKDTRTQLFVGNVRWRHLCPRALLDIDSIYSFRTECAGRISRICSAKLVLSYVPMLHLGRIIARGATGLCCWLRQKMLGGLWTCSMDILGKRVYLKSGWTVCLQNYSTIRTRCRSPTRPHRLLLLHLRQ